MISSLSSGKRLLDACHDGVVVGKEDPAFFGDFCVADPDRKFAAASFDQLDLDTEFTFDGGRRTGGPWSIRRSDFTETNAYVTHNILMRLYLDRVAVKRIKL
jgi:hypothetical protein